MSNVAVIAERPTLPSLSYIKIRAANIADAATVAMHAEEDSIRQRIQIDHLLAELVKLRDVTDELVAIQAVAEGRKNG